MAAKSTPSAKRTRTISGKRIHPHRASGIAPGTEIDEAPDQPFAQGVKDSIDTDLRHRIISEAAYHRYVKRGYAHGHDVDDWLQAEAHVDHVLLSRSATDGHS